MSFAGSSLIDRLQSAEIAAAVMCRSLCVLQVVLDCAVTDDLLYVKATPTFHHWRTRGKRFGLTFHSSADAQVFETCIQRAAHQLQDSTYFFLRSAISLSQHCLKLSVSAYI